MNLWFRLIGYLMTLAWRPRLTPPGDVSRLRFRVLPNDLDTSLHMNNGRYLAIMDLGRLDIMASAGLLRAVLAQGWTPVASSVLIRFRRELRLFQRYTLETRLVAWNDTAVVMEQLFVIEGGPRGGQVAARALFKGGLYDRTARTFVPVARLMREIGATAQSPVPSAEAAAFLAADDALKGGGDRPTD